MTSLELFVSLANNSNVLKQLLNDLRCFTLKPFTNLREKYKTSEIISVILDVCII